MFVDDEDVEIRLSMLEMDAKIQDARVKSLREEVNELIDEKRQLQDTVQKLVDFLQLKQDGNGAVYDPKKIVD